MISRYFIDRPILCLPLALAILGAGGYADALLDMQQRPVVRGFWRGLVVLVACVPLGLARTGLQERWRRRQAKLEGSKGDRS